MTGEILGMIYGISMLLSYFGLAITRENDNLHLLICVIPVVNTVLTIKHLYKMIKLVIKY